MTDSEWQFASGAAFPEREPHYTRLPRGAEKFRALGMQSVEEVLAATFAASREMEAWLGTSPAELLGNAIYAARMPSEAETAELFSLPCSLGANLGGRSENFDAYQLPTELSLIDVEACPLHITALPPVRDQANRGTCVAHAALAAYEHYLSTSTAALRDLSEQFLYWNAKRHDGIPNDEGTWLGVAMPRLEFDGVCEEYDWPYNPHPVAGNEGQHPPPSGTPAKALANRPPSVVSLPPNSVMDYRAHLQRGRCIAFSVPVYNSWLMSSAVRMSGNIHLPIPGERAAGGHAMCIVGCELSVENPALGGGRFVLRNSWGTGWAPRSVYGPGYGTIPFSYISRYGMEAWVVD